MYLFICQNTKHILSTVFGVRDIITRSEVRHVVTGGNRTYTDRTSGGHFSS